MIYNSKKLINSMLSPFLGDFDTLQWHKRNIKMNPLVSEAIDRIEKRWNIDKSEAKETPIFLLSAGWRSGSTLLQRLINSSDNILIWGEPYSYSDYVRKLADSLKIFSQITLPDNFIIDSFIDKNNNKITDGWTACLYPNPKNLQKAHRTFFLSLYSNPAKNLGYNNWGIKEVRFDVEYCFYLKWLFPKSKFVFLYRNPYESYRSYLTFRRWYDKWPNKPIFTPRSFGKMWRNILSGYLKEKDKFNSILIRYENLISGDYDFADLKLILGCNFDFDIIKKKISGRPSRKKID